VVLHHQHHDVLDLRQEIGAGRTRRLGERARLGRRAAAGEALHLTVFQQVPHERATSPHKSSVV
jgi:hypothetical protein